MGRKRTASDVARPWEPGSIDTGGARRRSGWGAVESPPVERDFLSQFASGGGQKGTQCRVRRHTPSLPLSLRLGSEEEEQQNREPEPAPAQPAVERDFLPQFAGGEDDEKATRCRSRRASSPCFPLTLRLGDSGEEKLINRKVDAAAVRSHHTHAPAPADITVAALSPLSAPRQACVGAPGYSYLLPRQASVGDPRRPAPRRPPSAPPRAPGPAGHLNPTARQDRNDARYLLGCGDVKATADGEAARRAESETWRRAALASETDRHVREAWLSQQGLLASQAVSAAMAASARATSPAAAATTAGMHMQWASADARFGCPGCRRGPPTLVTAPRPHLCLCWDCGYVFRDDPAVACPVCAAVRAWGIRA